VINVNIAKSKTSEINPLNRILQEVNYPNRNHNDKKRTVSYFYELTIRKGTRNIIKFLSIQVPVCKYLLIIHE
jgi:hypothetical protein